MRKFEKTIKIFAAIPLSLLFALVLSYHPGYLREYSLFSSIQKLGLSCLRYGRKELLILTTALFFVLLIASFITIRIEKKKKIWAAFFSALLTILVFLRDAVSVPVFRVFIWGLIFFAANFFLFCFVVCDFEIYLKNKNRIKQLKEKESILAAAIWSEYKYPFLSTVIFGFIAFNV